MNVVIHKKNRMIDNLHLEKIRIHTIHEKRQHPFFYLDIPV
jgi:hypothetical protein